MATETEKYRRRLIEERDELQQQLAGRTELPEQFDGVQDSADRSVQEHAQDLQGRVMNLKSNRLEQVNAALQRIDQGSYGVCVKCNQEIDPKRLDAEPTALSCMDCLSAQEQNFTAPTL